MKRARGMLKKDTGESRRTLRSWEVNVSELRGARVKIEPRIFVSKFDTRSINFVRQFYLVSYTVQLAQNFSNGNLVLLVTLVSIGELIKSDFDPHLVPSTP